MLLVGCTPKGRNTEQHDIYFSIGEHIKDLLPELEQFWPEAKERMHIDAWREVNIVDDYAITVLPATTESSTKEASLFFINLGGYKENEFEEFHYKMIVAAADKGAAIQKAKQTAFFQHTGFSGANSHIDDKFGIDVDDIFEITDILPAAIKEQYQIQVSTATTESTADEIHLGYFKLSMFR